VGELKTMGDLRKFLAAAMQDVRDGSLDQAKAGQIAKLAAQINASIHAEITARSHLEMKKGSFNQLTISDGIDVDDTKVVDISPDDGNKHSQIEYIGEREPGAELEDSDWPDIEIMLNKKRYNVTKISEIYKVDFKTMRTFIDRNQM
jgi:hypothetical protein